MFWSMLASISRRKLTMSSVGNSPNSPDFTRVTNSSSLTSSTMQSCSYKSQSRSFTVPLSDVGVGCVTHVRALSSDSSQAPSGVRLAHAVHLHEVHAPADDERSRADDNDRVPDLHKPPAQEAILELHDHRVGVVFERHGKPLHPRT